jgi:hypothetical protein
MGYRVEHVIDSNPTISDLPPDPDRHLSAEERDAIVSLPYIQLQLNATNASIQDRKLLWKLDMKLIPWVSFSCLPDAFFPADISALSLVLAVLLGSHQHRQC